MLEQQQKLVLSPYMAIYDLVVPQDNLLRKINELIDFSFVYNELIDKYCLDNGRNAVSPIRMFKYLLLKSIFDLSDVDIVERSKYDMSFKYFLDMAPEDEVIDPSSLTKFRKMRLKDMNLLDMLIEQTVRLALEKGIIKSKSIIVDATHTKSKYNQKSPREILQELSKKLRKSVYAIDESMKEKLPTKNTEDSLVKELEYCQKLIDTIKSNQELSNYPKVSDKLNMLEEVINDDIEHMSISKDKDAKIGHKTADTSFFGYKTHIAMTEERIITAATITTGEKNDGKELEALINKTLEAGMYVCKAGHMAFRKAKKSRRNQGDNPHISYFFDVEKCKCCPLKNGCYKDGSKTKTYTVTIKSDIHKEQIKFQGSDYFKEKSKERYKIEAKNSELKCRHGYDVASSSGLNAMEMQGALTIFAVNMKRIIKLMDDK